MIHILYIKIDQNFTLNLLDNTKRGLKFLKLKNSILLKHFLIFFYLF